MNKLFVWILVISLVLSGCAAPVAPTAAVLEPATAVPVPATATVAASPTALPTATPAPSPTAEPTATARPTASPTPNAAATASARKTANPAKIEDVVEFEMKGAFNFFWEQANTDAASAGFGLVRDRYPGSEGIASMASVGYALTAYLVGVEKGYITRQQGLERTSKTLDTLLKMDRVEGFYYHFVDMKTGKRAWNSEVSSIDSSILFMGVLAAGQYFGGDAAVKAKQIYDAVNWPWFIDKSRNMFYMAYRPEKGFEGHWDFYAEQLMIYILAAGSDTHPVDDTAYYTFTRHTGKYGTGKPFIHSWFGSIFTYQFTHAWVDFRGYTDQKKDNWFDNSVEASLAQYNFAVEWGPDYQTLGPDAWGITACDGPDGYNGLYGAPPSGFDNKSHTFDDTIAPAGAIGSILFLPQQAQEAMLNYYSFEDLKGKYGFKDAYNLSEDWYASDVIGIDKGVSLLMLANYQKDSVYNVHDEKCQHFKGFGTFKDKEKRIGTPSHDNHSRCGKFANVSVTSASYALNGIGTIGEDTRKRVLEAAEKLNYHPNAFARNLKKPKTRTIGVFISRFGGSFYEEILEGIHDAILKTDYELLVCPESRSIRKILTHRQVDGAIVFDSKVNSDLLLKLASKKFPIVVLDRFLEADYLLPLLIDNRQGTTEAFTHLYAQGARRIFFVSGALDSFDNSERMKAFLGEAQKKNVTVQIFNGNFTEDSGHEIARKIIESKDLPDAVFCANDQMAIGFIRAMKENNLQAPDDIAIVGFDDIQVSKYMHPTPVDGRRIAVCLGGTGSDPAD